MKTNTDRKRITKLHCIICGEDYPLLQFRAHARQQHYPSIHNDWQERINILVDDAGAYVKRYLQENPDSDYFFT